VGAATAAPGSALASASTVPYPARYPEQWRRPRRSREPSRRRSWQTSAPRSKVPLVSIRAGVYRSWKLGIAGAGALAVRHDQALLFGDYEERCLGRIVALDGDDATVVSEVLIHDARGEPLDKALAYGSGERLLFFKERQALVLPGW